MSATNHLILRKQVYYFRARVPSDLISVYGRPMVSVSLQTGDKTIAKDRLTAKVEEFNREIARLRRQSGKLADGYTGTVLYLSDDDIERLCLRYRAQRLGADEIDRIKGLGAAEHQFDLDILEDGMRVLRASPVAS